MAAIILVKQKIISIMERVTAILKLSGFMMVIGKRVKDMELANTKMLTIISMKDNGKMI